MARFPAFVLVFLVVITPATAAEPDAALVAKDATLSALGARPEESEEIRFRALVDAGDAARAKGRLREAALAYKDALGLRTSPLVRGRLGVLLVALGIPERAPEFLMDAIQLAGDASPAERQAFFRAYEEARALGTWVEVEVSHKGAAVALDDEKAFNDGQSACWIFVRAGEHVLRGLPGAVPPAPEPCAAPPQPQKIACARRSARGRSWC